MFQLPQTLLDMAACPLLHAGSASCLLRHPAGHRMYIAVMHRAGLPRILFTAWMVQCVVHLLLKVLQARRDAEALLTVARSIAPCIPFARLQHVHSVGT